MSHNHIHGRIKHKTNFFRESKTIGKKEITPKLSVLL